MPALRAWLLHPSGLTLCLCFLPAPPLSSLSPLQQAFPKVTGPQAESGQKPERASFRLSKNPPFYRQSQSVLSHSAALLCFLANCRTVAVPVSYCLLFLFSFRFYEHSGR